MSKAIKILLVVAIVCSTIQICTLIVKISEPTKLDEKYNENIRARAALCWKIYFFGGLPLAITGFVLKSKNEIPGFALIISGIYLMLLGNNGGLLSSGFEGPRLVTSIFTFSALMAISWNRRWN